MQEPSSADNSSADNSDETESAETMGADDESRRDTGATRATDVNGGATESDGSDTDAYDDTEADISEGESTAVAPLSGILTGAVAVVSAALGLVSLTGTSLGQMLRAREQLIGQIQLGTGGSGDQIEALYGAPWDTVAAVNGIFAFVAVAVGALLLAGLTGRPNIAPWVKAVALGGVVLGLVGLFVAGGMYFDLFASQPQLPTMPAPAPGG